jgi:hypothetical protein
MSETFEIVVPKYPKKIDGLVCEEIEGENTYFYIHEEHGTTLTLNIVASAIFDMCDGSNTAEDMAAIVSQTLEVNSEDALRDVREILQELTGFGFIQS